MVARPCAIGWQSAFGVFTHAMVPQGLVAVPIMSLPMQDIIDEK